MYYSAGNYEAFAKPLKNDAVDRKNAYIVGSGLAGLAAACFLVRDAQMPGSHIHILEKGDKSGGACDGADIPSRGFVMRGGREMDNHFECMWDLMRSIPSLETEGQSVLDEYYYLNKRDPNYSLMRATIAQGKDAKTKGKFALSDKATMEIMRIFFTPDEDLEGKRIDEVFSNEVFASNFWLYWRTMFAFENWHSALEMKLYLKRFIHHIDGLPDFSALRFTAYNQYESLILPIESYLKQHGVILEFSVEVTDIHFIKVETGLQADSLTLSRAGKTETISLSADDYLFMTLGGCVENSTMGDQHNPAVFDPVLKEGGGWDLWKRIAAQDKSFGHPEVFCSDPSKTNWMSATVTTSDSQIPSYVEKICRRDPFSGGTVTGGIVTVKDSAWLMSWTVNRQPQFKAQKKNQMVGWIYGLFTDVPGNYIKKRMDACTGEEICAEWLYHLGVPTDQIDALAAQSAVTVPVMMPYITAFFMPRRKGDRPKVVPKGASNFAFLGQFADTERDTVFTTEYSIRTGMEAVYTLLAVDRGVPEVWGSVFDIRALLHATYALRDGKKITDMNLGFTEKFVLKEGLKKLGNTDVVKLLSEYHLI